MGNIKTTSELVTMAVRRERRKLLKVKRLLRKVLDAPCGTSGGEYGAQSVEDAMKEAAEHPYDDEEAKEAAGNADLLAAVKKALKRERGG